ncbi:MAG: aryl-sulfate sulfotransferase [Haloferacaceae archaeon]
MRRRAARLTVALVVLALLVAATGTTLAYPARERPTLRAGHVSRPADGPTVISVQGFHVDGQGNRKKPARLVGVTPEGNRSWVVNGAHDGFRWFYDVDALSNGDLLVASTRPGSTLVYELDPETHERVWVQRLPIEDTHDVDMLPNGNLVVANMRNYDPKRGVSDDRVFVYDRHNDTVVWQWTVRNHFPNDTDGGFKPDWTHVNDVDAVDGGFIISLRNFDQVVKVNRSTKRIVWRLGRDGHHDTLFEQHNPDYLRGPNGTPTLLVADSENDRVVEYARRNGTWVRTWTLRGPLSWPRDADRLPNGDTLVTDTLHHRVIEVTPTGRVVWEFYAPWGPYDAERVTPDYRPVATGPTMAELNRTGTYRVHGGDPTAIVARTTPAELVRSLADGTPVGGPVSAAATRWSHVAPWIRPVWLPPWAFLYLLLAGLVLLGWAGAEAWLARGRLVARLRRVRGVTEDRGPSHGDD